MRAKFQEFQHFQEAYLVTDILVLELVTETSAPLKADPTSLRSKLNLQKMFCYLSHQEGVVPTGFSG